MQFKEQIDALLNKQMDRRGFLKHLFMGAAALLGLDTILRLTSDSDSHASPALGGYEAGAYGGNEDGK